MQIPHGVSQHVGLDLATNALKRMNAIRTLLFICSPGTISTAMTAAIESEFPWLCVKTVPDLKLASAEFDNPVQLMLADVRLASALAEYWPELARYHPAATLALIGTDDGEIASDHQRAKELEIVQGILPFNVNLDVFLSGLRIVLKGGTYFPSTGYRAQRSPPPETSEDPADTKPAPYNAGKQAIEKLTKRENEILARMAMGNQNKIIAAALSLSEHTVKIHIHNIITKLGVHNRTEVVALYFEYRRKDVTGNAGDTNRGQDGRSLSGDKY
ncbi:Putative GerE family transcriptional regulator [Neorhizobium galegae bv. officinalis bv. officinalis str. HAMBI 1141]|jgi:DNA-binding NarL/FixJ family response regulator|uniref:Putative GerE family transcriptional regulator n=1 Tax=Neorhizobium galegae bv. officinalis bv. officinalis str. HAMBI 1141 TaxID=1028801 RepID=A0A068TC97_NEOGA|nr:response regulator transcription factor [Neorhizobium galegae]CDN55734.1 Putative GerE family transcriptional regulator [Neorhizobium galegae bv. officinalis bv. officinalis str. HAMBI 1141]